MAEPLRLLAQGPGDVSPLSALLQDALLTAVDVAWDRRARRLVLLVSRYRWETGSRSRIRAALRIGSVLGLQRKNWPVRRDAPLDLLALSAVGDSVRLVFAGGPALRLQVECIDMVLEDVSDAWPVRIEPGHG